MYFDTKVAVVTGASAGIGAAIAGELSRRGASVALVARRTQLLELVAGGLEGPSQVLPADVTIRSELTRVLEAVLQRFGGVDIWVNNAGRGITRSVEQLSDSDLDAMVRDNVKSALYGMQVVLPHFKRRGAGVLVNVSSMLGRAPLVPIRSAYSASKAALNSLTESLRLELSRDYPNILVSLVLPGVVATDFGNNALGGGPDSRTLPGAQQAEEVAKIVADGLEQARQDIYTRPDALERVLKYLRNTAATSAITS